jgi:two-component system sensor histidine kinase KdpD
LTSSSTTSSAHNGERGRYTIFLGMAAGVGKTFRALVEAHSRLEAGEDVVIGYLETHGRADTERLAEGLERVPRRRLEYRGSVLEEMDVPAILLRRPELCLIDELAHTNAPGVEHVKRYEDIEDVLDAGVDVFSTLNVQHLESLNDRIAELSGVRVRETVPDAVLGRADEVILIDLPPDALLARLRAGKVYAPEKIEAALGGFFKVENLAALREAALRQVAEEVEARRLISIVPGREDEALVTEATQAVGERLLALVEPYPGAQRLVRRAWRSAQRLSANLDLLWVKTPGTTLDADQERALTALQQLASILGATLIVEEADDVPAGVARVARERGSTYILMGRARPPGPLARLRTPMPQRLMEQLPGVDVRIVADRTGRTEEP